MTDPIADLLTRIRNAIRARHQTVKLPSSLMKEAIVKILKEEGFISSYVVEDIQPQKQMTIFLKYDEERKSAIQRLRRVSKPGGRIYRGYQEIRSFLGGMGLTIYSTPKGVLTAKEARRQKVGGEILCEVW